MCAQPLLSLCIPTYNRCKYLRRSLDAIVNNKDFDSDIEVVISDNASTDETADLCKDFTRRYPNVKYYKNVENVNDRNFSLALDRATGRYVKLMNDNYILASTNKGFQLRHIHQSKTINIDEYLKDGIYSKVRKVILPQESYSIIGIDYNNELCYCPIEIAKN